MGKFCAILCLNLFINLTHFSSIFAESNAECKAIKKTSAHMRLKEYLFCNYESGYLPTPDGKNGTAISVTLTPKIANFNEEDGNLKLFAELSIAWRDPHFQWNSSSFAGITKLQVSSRDIWEPRIAVFSGGNENSNYYGLPYRAVCSLLNWEIVSCSVQIHHTFRCQTDFTQWPFDRQNCTLVFSTWLRSSEQIRFDEETGSTLYMNAFESNGEWTLTGSRVFFDQRNSSFSNSQEATSPRLSIDFILDRAHNHLSGRFILPAIIMMVMTLTTVWLDPRSIERFAVACVNPIIHLYCMQDLHWTLPHNGSTVPNILLFYACSLALATIALLLTFYLGNLGEKKIQSPKWISSIMAMILRSKFGQIFLLSKLDPKVAAEVEPDTDDCGDLMCSKSKTTAWTYVAIMFGWISFFGFLLIYITIYVVLIPNSSMRPPVEALRYFSLMEYI